MKKSLAIILALVLSVSIFPMATLAANIGDVVGYAQPTDIIATINGYKIESYNVDGYTYICVEDLRYYGFDVVYDDATRSLSFNRNSAAYIYPSTTNPNYSTIGTNSIRRPILYTDIVTYANGVYTPASNINGRTIINFNSLSQFGGVSYDNNKREISLTLYGVNTSTSTNTSASTSKPAASTTPSYTPSTPATTGTSAYARIKNIAMTKGTRSSSGDYHVYEIGDGYGFMTSYSPSDDVSTLFFSIETDDGTKGTTLITFHEGEKPYILFKMQSDIYSYSIFGQFQSAYAPFTVLKNEFPTASTRSSALNSVNSTLSLMDMISTKSTGLTFSSLGLYYTN